MFTVLVLVIALAIVWRLLRWLVMRRLEAAPHPAPRPAAPPSPVFAVGRVSRGITSTFYPQAMGARRG